MRGAWGIRAFLCVIFALVAVSCTNSASNDEIRPDFVSVFPDSKAADPQNLDWVAEGISLKCELPEGCPAQVGVLVFAKRGEKGSAEIHRCTAFLIEAGIEVASSGHCDYSKFSQGYFVLTRAGSEKKVWRKVSLLAKQYTPSPQGKKVQSGRPDAATFKLDSPILEIKGFKFPVGGELKPYKKLIAYVVNPIAGKSPLELSIAKLVCEIHRHELFFPFDIEERPDVITAFGCAGRGGNSGAPMIAEGTQNVEAIFAGTKETEQAAAEVRAEEGRDQYQYEKHISIEATNVRCISFVNQGRDADCVEATEKEKRGRFFDAQSEFLGYLRERRLPMAAQFETGFTNYVNQVRYDKVAGVTSFEVLYYPVCRVREIQRALIPIESLDMIFDEWARPTLALRSTYISEGQIYNRRGDIFHLQMYWRPSPLRYDDQGKDPRVRFGPSISVALPYCAR